MAAVNNTFQTTLAVLFLSLVSGSIQAATQLSLAAFPNARAVYQSESDTDDYRLALGALKKVNNVWRAEQEQRVSGRLHRDTLEAPPGFNAEEVYDFYADQLQGMNARVLFSCKGRRCGTSNSWANTRFGIKQLFGLDQYQHYGAFEIVDAREQLFFVALYTVRRGNKRVYAQVDVLQSRGGRQGEIAANPETISQQLEQRGHYVLPGLSAGSSSPRLDPQHLQSLVAALRLQRFMRVAVVGHDYGADGHAQRQEASLQYAQFVKNEIVQAGIPAARLEAYGLGGLAPERRGERSLRVEIVRISN